MTKLKPLNLGNFLRSQVPSSAEYFGALHVAFDDLDKIHKYISEFVPALENTPSDAFVSIANGIDGSVLYADKTAITGFLFDQTESRPKTISEALIELFRTVNTAILNTDVGTDIASIKDVIGLSKFYDGVPSSAGSLVAEDQNIKMMIQQLATDVYNVGGEIGSVMDPVVYSLGTDGTQTQGETIRELLNALIDIHGGRNQLGHSDIKSTETWGVSVSPASQIVTGNNPVLFAPFSNGEQYSTSLPLVGAPAFYNPYDKPVTIKGISAAVRENNVSSSPVIISLKRNDISTPIEVRIPPNTNGKFSAFVSEIELQPNDFIYFEVNAGTVPTETVRLLSISVIIEEIKN